jgi:Arc/MetJ-type ribon-helix-helix transcriptional regulator
MKTSTLTIRLSQSQREALRQCAKALKKTESEYIRDLLARDLDSRTLSEQIGSLAGSVDSSQTSAKPHPLKEIVRRRNWRK